MNKIIERMSETAYLSENDKVIAEYMIEHLEEIPKLSAREFAKRTYTSATSIIRFVKKLGYENYNDFKYNVVQALKNMNLDDEVTSNENHLSLLNKVTQLELNTIKEMNDMISLDLFDDIISLIHSTQYIDIFATDTNASIALYASHILSHFGKITQVYKDTDKQLYFSLNAPKDHVVFIMSKHSKNVRLLNMVTTLTHMGMNTIAITSIKNNKLADVCKYCIHTPFNASDDRMDELVFYSACKYIFDYFYTVLYSSDYERNNKIEDIYNKIFFSKL